MLRRHLAVTTDGNARKGNISHRLTFAICVWFLLAVAILGVEGGLNGDSQAPYKSRAEDTISEITVNRLTQRTMSNASLTSNNYSIISRPTELYDSSDIDEGELRRKPPPSGSGDDNNNNVDPSSNNGGAGTPSTTDPAKASDDADTTQKSGKTNTDMKTTIITVVIIFVLALTIMCGLCYYFPSLRRIFKCFEKKKCAAGYPIGNSRALQGGSSTRTRSATSGLASKLERLSKRSSTGSRRTQTTVSEDELDVSFGEEMESDSFPLGYTSSNVQPLTRISSRKLIAGTSAGSEAPPPRMKPARSPGTQSDLLRQPATRDRHNNIVTIPNQEDWKGTTSASSGNNATGASCVASNMNTSKSHATNSSSSKEGSMNHPRGAAKAIKSDGVPAQPMKPRATGTTSESHSRKTHDGMGELSKSSSIRIHSTAAGGGGSSSTAARKLGGTSKAEAKHSPTLSSQASFHKAISKGGPSSFARPPRHMEQQAGGNPSTGQRATRYYDYVEEPSDSFQL